MCVSKIKVNGTFVPCRKCWECLVHRQNEWIFRIKAEIKYSLNAWFMTYQYNEQNVPIYQQRLNKETGELKKEFVRGVQNVTTSDFVRTVYYKDLQDYFKRLRKKHPSIKYYAVPEYGEKTSRPHYHAIVISNEDVSRTPFLRNLQIMWDTYTDRKPTGNQNGYVHRDNATHRSIRYTIKYMTKRIKDTPIGADIPKAYISKGLGKTWIEDNKQFFYKNDQRYLVEDGGYKIPMPSYYKDKLFKFPWKTSKGDAKKDNRALREIIQNIQSIQIDQESAKLTDYQRFIQDTIRENKVSRATYERKERKLIKDSKSLRV